MIGKAINKWCGQKIRIKYGGKSVVATIMDIRSGYAGYDMNLSEAAWAAIDMAEWTRVQSSCSVVGSVSCSAAGRAWDVCAPDVSQVWPALTSQRSAQYPATRLLTLWIERVGLSEKGKGSVKAFPSSL